MRSNQEFERNLRWLFKQIESQKDQTKLSSIVTYFEADDKPGREYLLSCTKTRHLHLGGDRTPIFRVALEEVKNVVWRKRGLWMQLDFTVNA